MNSKRVMGLIGSSPAIVAFGRAALLAGFVVRWLEKSPKLAREISDGVARALDECVSCGRLSRGDREAAIGRLCWVSGCEDIGDAECIIEALTGGLSERRATLRQIERAGSARTFMAAAPGLFCVSELSAELKAPDRFLGLNVVNPDPHARVVELIHTPATSEQTLVEARAVCVKAGVTPVKVQDSRGYIGCRVSRPLFLEALRLVETGEAGIRTVDETMRQLCGMARGPFELLDRIGLDSDLAETEALHAALGGAAQFAPSAVQRELAAAGHVGCRSGRGFYDYTMGGPTPAYETPLKNPRAWTASPALRKLAGVLGVDADRRAWVFARIFAAVVNEAARVADTVALPRDVNLVMEFGYGFADGPLALADHIGLDVLQALLREFHGADGEGSRFAPNALLDRHVSGGNLGEKSAQGFLHHSL